MIMYALMQNTEHDLIIKFLHVAVGVIKDKEGKILISLRHNSAHQGGLWEFPGGKIESGELVEQALARELKEELNISVQELVPLITIKHEYSDLKVLLDVWTVTHFSGTAIGREGQEIQWVNHEQLVHYSFPEANYPIISAVRLPSEYAILNGENEHVILQRLVNLLDNDIKLIQARIKSFTAEAAMHFCELAMPLCKAKGAALLVNSSVKAVDRVHTDGIHLTAKDLLSLKQRPPGYTWVAASCHNQQELQHAEQIGVNFVVLAPVLPTKTHPNATTLGWEKFKTLTNRVNLPVFALGGMSRKDKYLAQISGAQGIAGISTFLL